MRWLILFGTIFLAFTLIQGTAVEEYVEKDHDEYVPQEDLEGTLSRGADYGHPKVGDRDATSRVFFRALFRREQTTTRRKFELGHFLT